MAAPASADGNACRSAHPIFKAHGLLGMLSTRLSRHEPIRILAIGSSSTQGVGASAPEYSYPAQLQEDLAALWREKVTVVNAGIGGETATRTVERLEAALTADSYDLVIWQVGTNDAVSGVVTEESFRNLLERGITAARSAHTDIILLDPQYFPTIRDPARYEKFVQTVGDVGDERKVSVFSRYAMMKDWGSHSIDDLRAMLSADNFHMGDKGYDCLASRVAEEIQTIVVQSVAQTGGKVVASAGRR
ncbi:SGNH/GDSL hydrolase family protein [Microvirga sp. 2TAF3]|uniref:SGNH/GDSL hydrolase family protein n=1 Tax=Microvirga sp. 2TAF3 TaxID=3233014 RepID=UPI003F97F7A6